MESGQGEDHHVLPQGASCRRCRRRGTLPLGRTPAASSTSPRCLCTRPRALGRVKLLIALNFLFSLYFFLMTTGIPFFLQGPPRTFSLSVFSLQCRRAPIVKHCHLHCKHGRRKLFFFPGWENEPERWKSNFSLLMPHRRFLYFFNPGNRETAANTPSCI